MIKKEVKLETMLARLIERDGYTRNRQPILDSINVTAAALSQYVRGRTRPSFDKLLALADFFEVSLDYLVYGELATTPTDPAPLARYVRQVLSDERARTTRHAELVARLCRLIMDRIDEATRGLEKELKAFEGLIELGDILRIEHYCQQADIATADLVADIILTDDNEATPGSFFSVVVDNLSRGCTYRFLLVDELTTRSPIVVRFQEMIKETVGADRLHEYCFFRTASSPVPGAPVLYKLNGPTFAMAEPSIFAQVSKYLLNDTWLGYFNRMSNESNADMLMSASHIMRSRHAFEVLWDAATT